MEVAGNTPVLVSASQVVDRLDENWEKLGPADMAAKAVSEMLASTAVADIGSYVDRVMVMRTFVDSVPDRIKPLLAPFGFSTKFARSVATRAGLDHAAAHYATAGGQSPQQYTARACRAIASGEARDRSLRCRSYRHYARSPTLRRNLGLVREPSG